MILSYSNMKNALGEVTGMSEDLIHVHVGLAIFVLTALVLRHRMRSPIPLTVVAVLALLNEALDYGAPGWKPGPSALDVVNTLVWPLILFLLARRGPARESNKVPTETSEVRA